MINLYNAEIFSLSLHRVGNKSRNEKMFISETPFKITDEMMPLLKEFFLKPFRDKDEIYYKFSHEVDLEYNEIYHVVKQMFAGGDTPAPGIIHEQSKRVVRHLFEQSNHPHIKNGEVYVAYFRNVDIHNNRTDAVGIFKSEILSDYLQFSESGKSLEMHLRNGIALDRMDKGCLIFKIEKEDGYRIMTVDGNRYDARYWLEHFLSVDPVIDDIYLTKQYMKFANEFGKTVIFPAEDKKEEVLFKNRVANFFGKNDVFEEEAFISEVIDNPDLVTEFRQFRIDKGAKYSLEDVVQFDIANEAVADGRKVLKNEISLDTNITIKLDFINPESMEKFVEKGWDEERQMYYYLVYFNKEQK